MFTENTQETPAPLASNPVDMFTKQLEMIVDESGRQKYNSLEDAIKALQHSQTYIPDLKSQLAAKESELQRLHEELSKNKSIEDIVSSLTTPQEKPVETNNNNNQSPQFSEEAIASMLQRMLDERQAASIQENNLGEVSRTLAGKFGDKADEMMTTKASELGMSLDDLKALSAKSPKAVLALFGGHTPAPSPVTGGLDLPPVNQQPTMADRLREAERKILTSGVNRGNTDLIAQLRKEAEAKYGITA